MDTSFVEQHLVYRADRALGALGRNVCFYVTARVLLEDRFGEGNWKCSDRPCRY